MSWLYSFILFAGLITGPLAHRFTARPVIIAGALIASVGAMLCYFATTIEFLTVTLGVVHGKLCRTYSSVLLTYIYLY